MGAIGGLIVASLVLGVLFDLKPAGLVAACIFAVIFAALFAHG